MFSPELRAGVAAGEITVSVRLWRRARVKAAGRYVSHGFEIEVDSVELLPFSAITEADVARSGEPDRESLRRRAAHAGPIDDDTLVTRVEFHVVAGYLGDPAVKQKWDSRYAEEKQLWSGAPNGGLVAEVAGMTPRRVLDVGCGEGADAVWLARRGWDVTALEVSGVALKRAAQHARDAGVTIRWVHAELDQAALPPRSFELVSAQYPALLRTPDGAAEHALLELVAVGGVLLLVHHIGMETREPHGGFDPADYVWPSMIAALLDDDWEIERHEQRPRVTPDSGAGAHHSEDLVLRARRLR
ncbi:MAG TPA: methyltransferase domain-containing protein [Mycobacteriales bacterium]|jgi:SAM-dependent methyltransferase|nr:methyltransferase domain-containing protein [Mycobacteriales bacterium]